MSDDRRASPPWGAWSVLADDDGFKVKRIEVVPGARLSYQKHLRREEHWYVVRGQALATVDGEEHSLREGDSLNVGKGAFHRIANVGNNLLVFVEVQRGDYFGEDDIIRLQDDYGRI
jgi:mannose-6-phosphate isomerase